MCQVNGKAEISTPPHSSHIFQSILINLTPRKISGIRPNTQNLVDVGRREGGLRREGIFRHFVICPFLYSCPRYRSHQKTDHDRLWLKTRVSA